MKTSIIGASALACLALAACGDDVDGPAGGGGAGGGTGEPAPLTVETDKGPVEGALVGSSRVFLGIPYAAPPVGDLRWRPPVPHEPWEALEAKTRLPACSQASVLTGLFDDNTSEDCLVLNVWAPEASSDTPRPVMVWIHGGAFVLGSGGEPAYDGQRLSETTGAIVVTLSYRLGPMGFLSLSELESEDPEHPSTGSYGLEDQRAALQWVQDNIAAFGGDPERVTLFGESAGGISTCFHLVSPLSEGLFARAIIESGPCDRAAPKASALTQGQTLVDALGCAGGDVLECVRSKTPQEVIEALPTSNDFLFGDGPNWFPIIDGHNLPDDPSALLEAGEFPDVQVILGSNADEGTLFFALSGEDGMVMDEAEFLALAEGLVPGRGADIVALYPTADYGTAQDAAEAAVGDAGFVCPSRRAARAIVSAGGSAHLYHFVHAPENTLLSDLGAFHSAEVRYVFGNPAQLIPSALTDEERAFSETIMGYWSRHTATGDPSGDGALAWPKYDEAEDTALVLDLDITTEAGIRADRCDFWDSVVVPVR